MMIISIFYSRNTKETIKHTIIIQRTRAYYNIVIEKINTVSLINIIYSGK
jgi:hypothetical protein